MTSAPCDDEAMRSLVGFLVLGRLSAGEHAAVTAHLRSCPPCREERDQVDGVVALLGRLSVADVQSLAAEFGAPEPVGAAAGADQLFGAPGAPRAVAAPPGPALVTPALVTKVEPRVVRRFGD